jgi:hypothetical protein
MKTVAKDFAPEYHAGKSWVLTLSIMPASDPEFSLENLIAPDRQKSDKPGKVCHFIDSDNNCFFWAEFLYA